MKRGRWLWALAIGGLGISPGCAGAYMRTVSLPPLQSLQTPNDPNPGITVMASGGLGVVWGVLSYGTERHPRPGVLHVYTAGTTGATVSLGSLTIPGNMNEGMELLASPDLVAAETVYETCRTSDAATDRASDARETPITYCTPPRHASAVFGVRMRPDLSTGCDTADVLALDGTRLLTPTALCDAANGAAVAMPAGVTAGRLAGNVVALSSGMDSVAVGLLSPPSLLYDAASDGPGAPIGNPGFDVQADGTAVVSTAQGLTIASPSEPQPRVISAAPPAPGSYLAPPLYAPEIADGVVGFVSPVAGSSTLELLDTSGASRASIDFPVDAFWDLRPSGLTWFARPCEQGVFSVLPGTVSGGASTLPLPAGGKLPAAPDGPCGLPAVRISAGMAGHVRIGYGCPASATLGCVAVMTLTVRRARASTDGSDVTAGVSQPDRAEIAIPTPLLAAAPGQSRSFSVTLPHTLSGAAVGVSAVTRAAPNADAPPVTATASATTTATVHIDG